MGFATLWRAALVTTVVVSVTYLAFLAILTVPYFQDHVIYLHRIKLTWFQDVNQPERWGFLRNQVTPFGLKTSDGETLHVWHILPPGLYRDHEEALRQEHSGFVTDVTSRLSFKLLRDDPEALLVIYLHGAAGTLASGYRPPSYRAISAGGPDRIHIVAVDYRGFGDSTGWPSESGILTDAATLVDWATKHAGIPPSRIVIFGQSIGTAVGLALTQTLATQEAPVSFAGIVLVAPFSDVERLTATYRLAGIIPLLSPLARFPPLLKYLNTFIVDKWDNKERIASLIKAYGNASAPLQPTYHITIIHAQDDYDIHWSHSEQLFWYAVNASTDSGISYDDFEQVKARTSVSLGEGGRITESRSNHGVIRQHILKHGLHDRIMSYPVVSVEIMRAFENGHLPVRTPSLLD